MKQLGLKLQVEICLWWGLYPGNKIFTRFNLALVKCRVFIGFLYFRRATTALHNSIQTSKKGFDMAKASNTFSDLAVDHFTQHIHPSLNLGCQRGSSSIYLAAAMVIFISSRRSIEEGSVL